MQYTKIPWFADGASGKIGKKVFYNRFGKTLVRKAPGSYNMNATPKQAEARQRFTAAHQFAQSIIADPVFKALYTKKAAGKRTAYSQAVSEFLLNHRGKEGTE
jgi:hypothetical protein